MDLADFSDTPPSRANSGPSRAQQQFIADLTEELGLAEEDVMDMAEDFFGDECSDKGVAAEVRDLTIWEATVVIDELVRLRDERRREHGGRGRR